MLVLFPGVEDEMALALELSRREGKSHHTPQKPQIQNRLPPESDRSRPSPYASTTHRSFSSAPFYNYGGTAGGSEDDEEDEDLQMALACSLSEMEAKQRATATDYISGAGGRGRVTNDKTGGDRGGRFVTTKHLHVAANKKVIAEEKDEEGDVKIGEKVGKGTGEPGFPPESSTAANTTLLNQYNEDELEPAIKMSNGSLKKKKKCGCIVC